MDETNDLVELIAARRASQPEAAPIWLAKPELAAELRRVGNLVCDSEASGEEALANAKGGRSRDS